MALSREIGISIGVKGPMDIEEVQSLPELDKLRQTLRSFAKQALEKSKPRYVKKLLEVLNDTEDLEKAIDQAHPLLGDGIPEWQELLTLQLDVELSFDELKRALNLLGTAVPELDSTWNAGAWTNYHYDHWVYESHAWLKRVEKLVKRICRSIIKQRSAQWQQIQNRLINKVSQMESTIGKVRNPLATVVEEV